MIPQAAGYRMVVELDSISKFADGSSLIEKPIEALDKEKHYRNQGVIVNMGEFCFDKYPANWCAEGQRVLFARYAGEYIEADNRDFRIINDLDVMAILPTTINSDVQKGATDAG